MQQELKTVEQNPASSTHLIKALEESEKKYALATQITSDGLWNWDLNLLRLKK